MFRSVRGPIKTVLFLTLDMCRPTVGHTYAILGQKAEEANWLPSPAPKVFSEIVAPTFEEQHVNRHDADSAKRLTDAITALMCDITLNPVRCERRPPMEKKNATFCFGLRG